MILKKMKGRGFRGVLSYCLNDKDAGPEHRAEIVGGNMSGSTADDLSKEFAQLWKLKPDAKGPVRHFAIRLHPRDKSLAADEWNKLAEDFCKQFGYGNTYKVFVLHRDSNPPHLHIITSQIGFDGRLNREYRDFHRIKAFCRQQETDLQLHKVSSKPTGNSRLYHVQKRGTCRLLPVSPRQKQFEALLQTARASRSVMAPTRKVDPLQQAAGNFVAAVEQQARSSNRYMQLLKAEGSLWAQYNNIKALLVRAQGTNLEHQLTAQLAEIQKQLAENLAARLRAMNEEAEQVAEQKTKRTRRFRL